MGNKKNPSDIEKYLYAFWEKYGDWITKYAEFATVFNTNIVKRSVSESDLNAMLEECSILILTANAVEQNILTQKLYNEMNARENSKQKLAEIYADGCVYQFATINNIKIVHMHPNSTSSFANGGSADTVRSALNRFRPKLVVSLGVAFGIDPAKQELGDVLLSSAIIPYDVFNKDINGVIWLRNEDKYVTHEALNAWNVLTRSPQFSLEKKASERQSLINRKLHFRWQLGTMLSGGSVLSNKKRKDALLRAAKKLGEDKVIGGEMEGIGVYSVCKKANVPCIIIKGICDWGADKNSWEQVIKLTNANYSEDNVFSIRENPATNDLIKDCIQAYATDHATEALFRLLRFDSNFLDVYSPSPRYGLHRIYKRFRKLEQIKAFFTLHGKALSTIVCIDCLFLLLLFLRHRIWGREIHIYEFLFLVFPVCIYIIKERMCLHPIKIHHAWVNLRFDFLDLEEGTAGVILNDSRPIFHCTAIWWSSDDKIIQNIQKIGTIKGNNFQHIRALKDFNTNTILQIEYELANGDQYAHLISRKKSSKRLSNMLRKISCFISQEPFVGKMKTKKRFIVYTERIYRLNQSKSCLVDKCNVMISRVANDR